MNVLSYEQLLFFEENGFLLLPAHVNTANKMDRVINALGQILKKVETQYGMASVSRQDRWSLENFTQRYLRLFEYCQQDLTQYFNIMLPKHLNLEPLTPINTDESVFNLMTDPALLDVMQSLLGEEIRSHPMQHIRVSLPERFTQGKGLSTLATCSPWHQDNGGLTLNDTYIVTVWLPLVDVEEPLGGLCLIPGSHQYGVLDKHDLDAHTKNHDSKTLSMKRGEMLLMHQNLIHRSLPNRSKRQLRISIDLRYLRNGCPTGLSRLDPASFLARSHKKPSSVLRCARQWRENWHRLRDALVEQSAESNDSDQIMERKCHHP